MLRFQRIGTILSIHICAMMIALPVNAQRNLRQRTIVDLSCSTEKPMNFGDVVTRARQVQLYDSEQRIRTPIFEDFALGSIQRPKNTKKFPSGERAAATLLDIARGKSGATYHQNVEPDGVTGILVQGDDPAYYADSMFFEAKTGGSSKNPIKLSTDDHQILGFIDYLDNSPAGIIFLNSPIPRLYFLTTANSRFRANIISTATRRGIAVFQSIACDTTGNGGILGTDDMIMGRSILLNEEVYLQTDIESVDVGEEILNQAPETPTKIAS